MTDGWFAVRARPGQEQKADADITSKGYQTLFPRILLRQSARIIPMFAGYVLVQFDSDDPHAWHDVHDSRGVYYIVGRESPVRLVTADVIYVRGLASAGVLRFHEDYSRPKVGNPVTVEDGPLAGMTGVLAAYSRNKAILDTDIGRVTVAADSLRHVELSIFDIVADQVTGLDRVMRNKLQRILRGQPSPTTPDLRLGCTLGKMIQLIQGQFSPGMTWQNWGSVWQFAYERTPASFEFREEADRAENIVPLRIRDVKVRVARDALMMEYSRNQ